MLPKIGDKIRYHDNGAPGNTVRPDLSSAVKIPDGAVGTVVCLANEWTTDPFKVMACFDGVGTTWIRDGFWSVVPTSKTPARPPLHAVENVIQQADQATCHHVFHFDYVRHLVRAGAEIEHLMGDEVIINLPDTFPLVLCEH